jgi:hypothetical protein
MTPSQYRLAAELVEIIHEDFQGPRCTCPGSLLHRDIHKVDMLDMNLSIIASNVRFESAKEALHRRYLKQLLEQAAG